MALEVEVKFLVADLPTFREQVIAAGGVLHLPRTFERNIRYDNAWEGLRRQDKLLRLRQDTGNVITYKGAAQNSDTTQVKIREEIEINVDSFDNAAAILERIGFQAVQVYEKYRETFIFGPVELVLDEMPFGNFMELEGEEAEIIAAAQRLGLDWSQRLTANYLYLLSLLNTHYGLAINDLTFTNFAGQNLHIAEVLGQSSSYAILD
ncbi:MAG: class IV adenylate cyclase [Chloroflexi bacterium]|nr:class IV adenylate cyclase [Chloroflexota bacterium]MBP8059065.1 class IV adenylate cyclase [Chloroflexota bacterium]